VCLAQNIDDIAQDVIKTKGHMNGLHSELDQITQNQEDLKTQLNTILEKLEIIEKAVENMKASYQEESQPASPVLIPTNDASFSFFSSSPPSEKRALTLKQLASGLRNPTMVRIAEICQLAYEKLSLVQKQGKELETQIEQAKADSLAKQLALVHISTDQCLSIKAMDGETKPEPNPESSKPSSSRTSAWEQWCNARYTGSKKAPMDIDGHPQTSIKHTDTAPVSNVDCKSKLEIENMIQGWHAWAKTHKLLFKDKVSWSDLALRLTWGFTGNLSFWWERISDNSKLRIIQHDKPIDELIKAVVHEFYGDIRVNMSHYADMFMSQRLCHLNQLQKYFCTMQALLYKVPDPRNSAYLRKYLSSMPGKVPELVRTRLEDLEIDIEDLSLAGLQEQIVTPSKMSVLERRQQNP
jgi:hypothetical protein